MRNILNARMPKLLFIVSMALLFSALCTRADESFAGDKGVWFIGRCGMDAERASALQAPLSTVAGVLQNAKAGDKQTFLDTWISNPNEPAPWVPELFSELKLWTQDYIYLIVEHAQLTNTTSSHSEIWAAVSVVPAAVRNPTDSAPAPVSTNDLKLDLRPRVMFAKFEAGAWKLWPASFDKKLEARMLKLAERHVVRPSSVYTIERINEIERQRRPAILEMMRKNGIKDEGIASQRERWSVEDSVGEIRTWKQWTNHYHATVIDPPVSFRRAEAFAYSYDEPITAFRSYMRAMWVGDAEALLKHADSSGKASHKRIGVDLSEKRATYEITNQFRHVTILLTATTRFENQDYVLLLWRAQDETQPQRGRIALQTAVFVRENGGYLLTRNLRDGYFGRVTKIAGVTDGVWKYPDFVALMSMSQFPTNFFSVTEGE